MDVRDQPGIEDFPSDLLEERHVDDVEDRTRVVFCELDEGVKGWVVPISVISSVSPTGGGGSYEGG